MGKNCKTSHKPKISGGIPLVLGKTFKTAHKPKMSRGGLPVLGNTPKKAHYFFLKLSINPMLQTHPKMSVRVPVLDMTLKKAHKLILKMSNHIMTFQSKAILIQIYWVKSCSSIVTLGINMEENLLWNFLKLVFFKVPD